MPLALGRLSRAIIDLLVQRGPTPRSDLYSILQNEYWDLSRGLTSEEVLREQYLSPLWKQGLIAETPQGYTIGSQWELIQPYEESLRRARESRLKIEQLASQEGWIEKERIGWATALPSPTPSQSLPTPNQSLAYLQARPSASQGGT